MTTVPHMLDPQDPAPPRVPLHPELYTKIVQITCGAYAVLALLGILTWNVMLLPFMNVGGAFFLVAILHAAASIEWVKTTEWAGFYFYGKALKEAQPGLHFRPKGLVQVEKAPRQLYEFQAPGEPEEIFYGDDKDPLPKGMVRPIRITTREPAANETGNLDVQMTVEWMFYVQFQIFDFFQFISIVGSFKHAQRLLRDTGEAVLNTYASRRTVNGMIKDTLKINKEIDNRIRKLTRRWSIEVYEVKTLAPNLSHALAAEMRNVPMARLRAEQTRTTASAERFRLAEEGEGSASAERAMLTAKADGRKAFLVAEADGLGAKMKKLGVDGEVVIAAEVASDALQHADSIIVGSGGMADVASFTRVVQDTLGRKTATT